MEEQVKERDEVMEHPPIPANEQPRQQSSGTSRTYKVRDLRWLPGIALILLGTLALISQFTNFSAFFWSVALMVTALPFLGVFMVNRKHWWALIPAYVLGVTGAFIMVEPLLPGDWDAAYWLAAVGAPFLLVWLLHPKKHWWALIPTYVMGVTAVFIPLEGSLSGELDGAYWIFAVGAPFVLVWLLRPKKNWWALIPAYIMAVTGVFVMIESSMRGDMDGAYWLFAFAAPFIFVFITNPRKNWWGLIPGGIALAVGIGLLAAAYIEYIIPAALILGGLFLLIRQMGAGRRSESSPDQTEEPLG